MRCILLILIGLMMAPNAVHAYDAQFALQQRLCQRVERRFSHDAATLRSAQQWIQREYGFTCASRTNVYNASLLSQHVPANAEFDVALQQLKSALAAQEPVPVQAYAMDNMLRVYESLGTQQKQHYISDLVSTSIQYFYREDMIYRVRFENSLARFVGIVKQSSDPTHRTAVRQLLTGRILMQESGETMQQFASRRSRALELWDQLDILVYYWSETLTESPHHVDRQKHDQLLESLLHMKHSGIPAGMEHVHLIIVRDDAGPTADIGTVWVNTRVSLRTLIHEAGHTVHYTHPAIVENFAQFKELFHASVPDRENKGDFVTTYHTNEYEDFAELYTEFIYADSLEPDVIERAQQRARNNQPLLLQKVQFLVRNLFGDTPVFTRHQWGKDGLQWQYVSYPSL